MTRRATEARNRRLKLEPGVSAGENASLQVEAAWRWLLAEVRSLTKPRVRRWAEKGRPVGDILAEVRDELTVIARRLNEEGARR